MNRYRFSNLTLATDRIISVHELRTGILHVTDIVEPLRILRHLPLMMRLCKPLLHALLVVCTECGDRYRQADPERGDRHYPPVIHLALAILLKPDLPPYHRLSEHEPAAYAENRLFGGVEHIFKPHGKDRCEKQRRHHQNEENPESRAFPVFRGEMVDHPAHRERHDVDHQRKRAAEINAPYGDYVGERDHAALPFAPEIIAPLRVLMFLK